MFSEFTHISTSEEIDISIPAVIKCCVNGTGDAGKAFGDESGVSYSLRVLFISPIVLIVIAPVLSTWRGEYDWRK